MGWRTSIIELLLLGTVLVVVAKAEHSQKPTILSSNNKTTQSNASNSKTWANLYFSQMASFCFRNCREQNDNQREKSLTLSYLGVGGGQLSREIFPRNGYQCSPCFSCSSTGLSSQSLWSSFTSNTPEAFLVSAICLYLPSHLKPFPLAFMLLALILHLQLE